MGVLLYIRYACAHTRTDVYPRARIIYIAPLDLKESGCRADLPRNFAPFIYILGGRFARRDAL